MENNNTQTTPQVTPQPPASGGNPPDKLFEFVSTKENASGSPLYVGTRENFDAQLKDPTKSRLFFDAMVKKQYLPFENSDKGYEDFRREYFNEAPLSDFTPDGLTQAPLGDNIRHIDDPKVRMFDEKMNTLREESQVARERKARLEQSRIEMYGDDGITDGPKLAAITSSDEGIIRNVREDIFLKEETIDRQYDVAAKRTSVIVSLAQEGPALKENFGVLKEVQVGEEDENPYAEVDGFIEKTLAKTGRESSASYFKTKLKTLGLDSKEAFQARDKYLSSAMQDLSTNEAEIAEIHPDAYNDYRKVTEDLGPHIGVYNAQFEKIQQQTNQDVRDQMWAELDQYAEENNLNTTAAQYRNLLQDENSPASMLSQIDKGRMKLHELSDVMRNDQTYVKFKEEQQKFKDEATRDYTVQKYQGGPAGTPSRMFMNKLVSSVQMLSAIPKAVGDVINPDEYTSYDSALDTWTEFFDPQRYKATYLPESVRGPILNKQVTLPSGEVVNVDAEGRIEGRVSDEVQDEFSRLPAAQRTPTTKVNIESALNASISGIADMAVIMTGVGGAAKVTSSAAATRGLQLGYYAAQGTQGAYEDAVQSLGQENRRLAANYALTSGATQAAISMFNPMENRILPSNFQFGFARKNALKRAQKIIDEGGSRSFALKSAHSEFFEAAREAQRRVGQYGLDVVKEGAEGAMEGVAQETLKRAANIVADITEDGTAVGERMNEDSFSEAVINGFIEEAIGGIGAAGFSSGKSRSVLDREALMMAYDQKPKNRELIIQRLRNRGDVQGANRMRRVFDKADTLFEESNLGEGLNESDALRNKTWAFHDLHEREGLLDELKREDLSQEDKERVEDRIVDLDNRITFMLKENDIPDDLRQEQTYDFDTDEESGVTQTSTEFTKNTFTINDAGQSGMNLGTGEIGGRPTSTTDVTVTKTKKIYSNQSKGYTSSESLRADSESYDIHTRVAARKLARMMDADPNLIGKVVIHADDAAVDAYVAAQKEIEGNQGIPDEIPNLRGMFVSREGEIHINAKRVSGDTPAHEYAHAVMLGLESSNPDIIDSMYSRLVSEEGFPSNDDGEKISKTEKIEAIADFFGQAEGGVRFMKDQRSMSELFRAVREDLRKAENPSLFTRMIRFIDDELGISDIVAGDDPPTVVEDPTADDATESPVENWSSERMGILAIKFQDAIKRGRSLNSDNAHYSDFEQEYLFSKAQDKRLQDEVHMDWYKSQMARGESQATESTKKTFGLNDSEIKRIKKQIAKEEAKKQTLKVKTGRMFRKLKAARKTQLLAGGNLTKSVKREVERADGVQRREVLKASNLVKEFEKRRKKVNAGRGKNNKITDEIITSYMTGEMTDAERTKVPKILRPILDDIRQHLDNLSDMYASDDMFNQEIRDVLSGNKGTYLARSYRAYWNKDYEPSDVVRAKAVDMYYKDHDGKPIKGHESLVVGSKSYERQLMSEANRYVTDILNDAKDIASKKKGFDPFKVRNEDLEKYYRLLLGEETNPMTRYLASVDKGIGGYTRRKMVVNMVQAGMFPKNGEEPIFFDSDVFADQTGDLEKLNLKDSQLEDISNVIGINFTGRRIYASKDVAEAFREAQGEAIGWEAVRGILMTNVKPVQSANYFINFNKTVLSYPTHAKNVFGNSYFALANNWLVGSYKNLGDAMSATLAANGFGDKAAYGSTESKKKIGEGLTSAIDFMIQEGVMQNDVRMGVLRSISEDGSGLAGWVRKRESRNQKGIATKAAKALTKAGETAQSLYQAEDDVWKVIGFLTERARYAEALYGKPFSKLTNVEQLEVSEKAADIVKDILPNYSRLGRLQQVLAKSPVIGNFLAFKSEAIRVTANSLALSASEIRDPKLRKIGAARSMGNIAAASVSAGIVSILSSTVGNLYDELAEDDDPSLKKAVSFIAPKFNEFGGNAIMRTDNPNVFTLMDVTAIDPKSTFYDAAMGLALADNMWEATQNLVGVGTEGFFDETILAGRIKEALLNQDAYGNPIVFEHNERRAKGFSENFALRAAHVAKEFIPASSSIKSAEKFINSEEKNREFFAQITGARSYDVDVRDVFYYSAKPLLEEMSQISYEGGRILNDEDASPDEKATALYHAMEMRLLSLNDVKEQYNAFVNLGATPSDLQQRLMRISKEMVDSEGNEVYKATNYNAMDRDYIFGYDSFSIPERFKQDWLNYTELGLITPEQIEKLNEYAER